MFTQAIKEIKKAIKAGRHVMKDYVATYPGEGGTAIYIDGKLAVIVSETLRPWWNYETKKAKLNTDLIQSI